MRTYTASSIFLTAVLSLASLASAAGAESSPRQIIALDGIWQIEGGSMNAAPKEFTRKIAVPSLVDLAEPAIAGQPEAFWYRRTFRLDGPIPEVAVLKVHKAMYGTRVILNGKPLGDHLPCFTPGLFDAQSALKVGDNEVLIRVGGSPACVPKPIPTGFDNEKRRYIAGIFDSVELILTGTPHILRVQAVPDIEKKAVTVHAWLRDAKTPSAVKLHVTIREASTGKVAGEADCEIGAGEGPERTGKATVTVQNCRLWSPEDPFLYELEVRGQADVLKTRFGMRSFTFDKKGRALLNGKPYYMRGSNVTLYRFFEDGQRGDKPWREDWVRRLHKAFRGVHWNSLRYSIGFPPEMWYRVADEEGLLIQDEFPIWYMMPGPNDLNGDELAKEYTEWMQERWNHPCVVIWDACNETPSPETGKAIRKVRGLDLSDRPWDNGWALPDRKGDVYEAHHYHYKDGKFELKYMGAMPKVPGGNAYRNKDKNPIVLNEYGWLWLNRDGNPTTLTRDVYALIAPGATPKQRLEIYARHLAAETEFWRSGRACAAVLHFCCLGYSRHDGQTSDHWADLEKLTWDPDFHKYVRDSFAPVGLMINAWAPTYAAGETCDFPIIVINDLYDDWKGTVRLRLLREGKTVLETSAPATVDSLGKTVVTLSIDMPKELGNYQVEATLVKPGMEEVRSVRLFKVTAGK